MQRALLIVSIAILGLSVWLWVFDGAAAVSNWAISGQETAQRALAGAMRSLRAGETGALLALLGLCFSYGFFHAAGPGHGKILIGGYGLGRKVPLMRLSTLALASSLAQGASAILLVGIASALLGWGRVELVGAAEDWFAPVSYGAIALVGLWLLTRGLRGLARLWRSGQPAAETEHLHVAPRSGDHISGHVHHPDHSHHSDDEICPTCGHAHGPTMQEAEEVRSLRDAIAIISAIALRPCTGAIFVLILTFRWGLVWQGISAVVAMSIGTASITIAVAIAAVTLREGALKQSLANLSNHGAARAMSLVEVAVGAGVALIASGLVLRAL